jgi:membrane-associated phospholipid phosphatase
MLSLFKKNSAFFIPYFIFLLAGGIILLLWNKTDIHLFINKYHTTTADFFFSNWTSLGLGIMIIPVALILAFIRLRYMLISIVGFIVSGLINDLFKKLFHSPRPSIIFADMHQSLYHVPNVDLYADYSFPSGHATTSFCMFCLLAFYTKNNLLKTIYFIIALLIAYSRMYLSEHFLKDVYAGSILGVSCALLIYNWLTNAKMFDKFAERLDKPLIRLNFNRNNN